MSPTLFGRVYTVTVGGQPVDGMRCTFSIERTLKTQPNTAEVVLYNLSASNRKRLATKAGVPVSVSAGYVDTGATLLFAGEMRESHSSQDATGTWATVLRAGDGDAAHRAGKHARSFRAPVNADQILSAMASDMQAGLGNMKNELKTGNFSGIGKTLQTAFTSSGSVTKQVDKLLLSMGKEWSIQDGQLQILRAGNVVYVPQAAILRRDTGLEGTPQINGEGHMSCRCRLVPGLAPGYPIKVVSDVVGEGVWRIERARYAGDTHGDEWTAELECRRVTL